MYRCRLSCQWGGKKNPPLRGPGRPATVDEHLLDECIGVDIREIRRYVRTQRKRSDQTTFTSFRDRTHMTKASTPVLDIAWSLDEASAKTGRIIALDHLTLPIVGDGSASSTLAAFLRHKLKCTNDPTQKWMHLNVGMNQLHLLPFQPKNARFPGRIVLLFPTRPPQRTLVDPHGNVYECYQAPSEYMEWSERKGRWPGPVIGMPILEHLVPVDTVHGIARYFEHYFKTQSLVLENDAKQAVCIVPVGPYQRLVFRESSEYTKANKRGIQGLVH